MKPKKLNYNGNSKVIAYIVTCINWLLDLSVSKLDDVELDDLSDGQILKYDGTEEKWINVDETGGTEVEANPQGTPTDTLNTIEIDGVIYSVEGGSPTPTENIKYTIVTASTGDYDAAITINKYIDDVLDTTETLLYSDILGIWEDYDYFKVGYNVINTPYWSVQVLHDIEEYADGYTDTWHYTNTKNITLTVDSGDISADGVSYDNTTSHLNADDVQEAIDELADEKADKSNSLSGYGITDAYTKTEIDTALGSKANTSDIPTKTSDITNDSNFVSDANYVHTDNNYTTTEKSKLTGIEIGAQVNTVTSVAGKTGAVTLAKLDVGLSNVENTSDLNKPISTATQNALNNKVDKYKTITTSTDLNTILETGFYAIPDGCTNKPSDMAGGGKGTLIVSTHPYGASAGLVLQILVNQLNVNSTDKMYYRIGTIGTQTTSFLDWNRVLNLDDIPMIASAIKQWDTSGYTIDLYGIGLPQTYYPASSTYSGERYLNVNAGTMHDCLQTGADTYTWRQLPVNLQLKTDINTQRLDDLGLSVVNGQLCITYEE